MMQCGRQVKYKGKTDKRFDAHSVNCKKLSTSRHERQIMHKSEVHTGKAAAADNRQADTRGRYDAVLHKKYR